MPETPVDPTSKLTAGTIESRAADIDTVISPTRGASGSAVSFGEGVYLSVGHNFYQNNGVNGAATGTSAVGTGFTLTLREGHTGGTLTEAGDLAGTNANVTNIGNYVGDVSNLTTPPTIPASGRQDLAAVAIPGADGPNSSAIVYQNSADIEGDARSAGYPGAGGPITSAINPLTSLPYDTESMMVTEGSITQGGQTGDANIQTHPNYQTEYLETDKDQTSWSPTFLNPFNTTTVEGMSSLGGQSGSGVDIATSLTSGDERLTPIDLENRLMGSVTYGSSDGTSNAAGQVDNNQTATHWGAGVTPLRPSSYQALAGVAENAAQTNNTLATPTGTTVTPLTPQQIADKFDTQTLITDQQGADGSSSTFNGTGLNEISYMNQNVNVNMNLGAGTDTANYFYLDTGIDATIGTNSIEVTKTYDTSSTVNIPGPLGISVPITIPGTGTATDSVRGAENLVGTGSDDTYTIDALSGVQSLDGRDLPLKADGTAHAESDTLQLAEGMGPVTWTFDKNPDGSVNRENGTVSNGTDTVRFDHMENVVTRNGDTVDGVVQGAEASQETRLEEAAPLPTTVPLRDAVEMLAEDEAAISESSDTTINGEIGQVMATPLPAQMYQNLSDAGVESVNAMITSDMDPVDRAGELLRAGYDATREAGLQLPESSIPEATANQVLETQTPEVEAEYDYAM